MGRRSSPRRKAVVAAGDLVPGALREMGVASERVTSRVRDAWARAADPAWEGQAAPVNLVGGVLVVEVGSASLREELSQFHRERLLRVLQAGLEGVPIVALRFVAGAGAPGAGR
jgi:hypothetical protein